LKTLLEAQPELMVVAEAVNGREAVEMAERYHPDVVILDLNTPELDGLSAAQRIRHVAPQSKLLVLTQHDAPYTVRRALDAGLLGYVLKSDASHDLIAAAEAVCHHKIFLSSNIARDV
jgi:DNA-binding NarL/FixJ family response regulator